MIPFNIPYVPESSKKYALEVMESNHQQGDGPFTTKASKVVSDLVGGGHVLLTPSCTHALEMASMLMNLGPGDEVIMPSFNFTSAATAVTKFGATPVFVDIERQTKGIDVNQVREAISPRTKAISWVNYAGVAPDIENLQNLGREYGLLLIEDNAHGLGGAYKGRPLGSFGDFATQSFHATKNFQCGEGGALVINNSKYIERAEIIREKGTNRSKYVRGEVQKYQWVDQGSSYLLAEVLAAILFGQLTHYDEIQLRRRNVWGYYFDTLSKLDFDNYQISLNVNPEAANVAHLFFIEAKSEAQREEIRMKMLSAGYQVTSHYLPLNSSLYGTKFLNQQIKLQESSRFSSQILRLPLHLYLDDQQLNKLLSKLQDILLEVL
jgi:dTDP-4-amino-4,6-dideoxygalactose transaminase